VIISGQIRSPRCVHLARSSSQGIGVFKIDKVDKRAKDPRWDREDKSQGTARAEVQQRDEAGEKQEPLYGGFGKISWLVEVRDVASRLDILDRRLN
jgi:hypothetical protein